MQNSNKIASYIMITVSAGLIQWHGISFWGETTGQEFGGAWSIALEFAMLWLWYHRKLILVRYLAAVILIAGPWYQLAGPAISTIYDHKTHTSHIISLETEIADLNKSIRIYELNSEKKLGWASRIDRTRSAITEARTKLRDIRNQSDLSGENWKSLMVAIIQAIVLLIVMTTQLSAVSNLRNCNISAITGQITKGETVPKTETFKAKTAKGEKDELIQEIGPILREKLKEFGNSQKDMVDHCKTFRTADISMVLNHSNLMASGKETISMPALNRIITALNINK